MKTFMFGCKFELAFWRYIFAIQFHPLNWRLMYLGLNGDHYLILGLFTFELQDMKWEPTPKLDQEYPDKPEQGIFKNR